MKALLLIDIQNDYFPNGKMELVGSESAGLMAGKLLAACRDKKLPVFHIQHISTRPGAVFFLPDTTGVEIHPCVKPLANEAVIKKKIIRIPFGKRLCCGTYRPRRSQNSSWPV